MTLQEIDALRRLRLHRRWSYRDLAADIGTVTDSGLRRVLTTPNPSRIYEVTSYHLRRYLARKDVQAELAAITSSDRRAMPKRRIRRARTAPSAA
jgi:hypothetical protein